MPNLKNINIDKKIFSLNINFNSEEKFIQNFLLPLTYKNKASRNLQDDIAFVKNVESLLITTDSICEGIHYKEGIEPEKISYKLLARNLSDIACKGGIPLYYTLSILASKNTTSDFLENFTKGLGPLTKKFKIALIGGDLARTKSSKFAASLTLYAKPASTVPHRNGSQIKDYIYITGKLGRAYLGYIGKQDFLSFYETPNPPLRLMQKIFKKYIITSSIDISDGFIKDLKTLLYASRAGGVIDYNSLPFATLPGDSNFLTFGDDYEVIFTSPNYICEKEISHIGYVTDSASLEITNVPENFHIQREGYSQI